MSVREVSVWSERGMRGGDVSMRIIVIIKDIITAIRNEAESTYLNVSLFQPPEVPIIMIMIMYSEMVRVGEGVWECGVYG